VLYPDSGGVHDGADDAHHSIDATRIAARLPEEEQEQYRLQCSTQVVRSDRKGMQLCIDLSPESFAKELPTDVIT